MDRAGEAKEHAEAQMVRAQQAGRLSLVRTGWVLLMFVAIIPALAAQTQQRVVRDGTAWVQESSGPLGGEKSLQVTRFVGAVRVVAGASRAATCSGCAPKRYLKTMRASSSAAIISA